MTTTLPEINSQNKKQPISKPKLNSDELLQAQTDKSNLSHSNDAFGAYIFDGELDDTTMSFSYVTDDRDIDEDAQPDLIYTAQIG